MRFNYKFFSVQPLPLESGRTTRDHRVVNLTSGDAIGGISWYGAWRQFCFFPGMGTVWSVDCLEHITDAIAKIAEEHRAERAAARSQDPE